MGEALSRYGLPRRVTLRAPLLAVPSTPAHLAGMTQACKDQYPAGFETWAVGYYNEWGGVAFGKAIPKTGVPQVAEYLGTKMPAGLPFPQGTLEFRDDQVLVRHNFPVQSTPD